MTMKLLKSINTNVKFYILADGFYYAGYSVVNAFLSILITSKVTGGRLDMVGYAISCYMFVRALTEIPISRWTKKFSLLTKRNIIAYSYVLYGVLIFLLGYSIQLWHIFFIQTLVGLLDAMAYPIKWTIFTKIVDRGNEELEWGLEDIASTFLPAIFTALAGIVSASYGLEYAFLLFAILLVVSGLTFFSIKQNGNLNLEIILSNNQKEVLKKVIKVFKENEIQFQVSGGLAAIIYGAKRPLYDIDIEVYKKDILKTRELFQNDISEDLYHLQDENFDLWLLTLKIDGVPVDISQADECYFGDGKSEKIRSDADLSKAQFMNFDGIGIPVTSKAELIEYKKVLARETDLVDIKQIS